ncbi:MAG: ion channel [Verrucomicrobiales bacterium]
MLLLVGIAALLLIANFSLQIGLIEHSTTAIVRASKAEKLGARPLQDTLLMARVLLRVLTVHLVQMALWATAFLTVGEFEDFQTAFYHSAVNFASLGYGDIIMSERWRLLGALEAATGMMMFGVSTALLFAIISKIIRNRLDQAGVELPK